MQQAFSALAQDLVSLSALTAVYRGALPEKKHLKTSLDFLKGAWGSPGSASDRRPEAGGNDLPVAGGRDDLTDEAMISRLLEAGSSLDRIGVLLADSDASKALAATLETTLVFKESGAAPGVIKKSAEAKKLPEEDIIKDICGLSEGLSSLIVVLDENGDRQGSFLGSDSENHKNALRDWFGEVYEACQKPKKAKKELLKLGRFFSTNRWVFSTQKSVLFETTKIPRLFRKHPIQAPHNAAGIFSAVRKKCHHRPLPAAKLQTQNIHRRGYNTQGQNHNQEYSSRTNSSALSS